MLSRTAFGYHDIGDFHFFTVLPEAATWLGSRPEDTFRTHESFLSLVAAVHETYHVIQDLLLGLSCWASAGKDDLAAYALTDDFPAGTVDSLIQDSEFVRRLINSRELTARLIQRKPEDAAASPDDLHVAMLDLTGRDLLECHAAILTEIYIARLMQDRPEAFSLPVVDDLAACFRVSLMPDYNRPLKIFRTIMNPIIDFDSAGRTHPLYGQCSCIVEYDFLAFLLDLALHVPRPEWIGPQDMYSAASAMEDIAPSCRFLKLTFAFFQRVLEAKRTASKLHLEFPELYSSLSKDLVRLVNIANMMAKAKNQGGSRRSFTISELLQLDRAQILRHLGLENWQDSFIEFDSITSRWLTYYRRHPLRTAFPRVYSTRIRAMKVRLSDPAIVFAADVNPLTILADLGIPGYFRTTEGVKMRAPAMVVKDVALHDLKELDLAFAFRTVDPTSIESEAEMATVFEAVGLPYDFLKEVVSHEITVAIATALCKRVSMRCPLTTSRLDFYHCPARNAACQNVTDLEELPLTSCIARSIRDTHFG